MKNYVTFRITVQIKNSNRIVTLTAKPGLEPEAP